MKKHFRIHGDNIVECERLYDLIESSITIESAERCFISPACMSVSVTTTMSDKFTFDFFPGFNKNSSDRWTSNIFQLLKENGSFLNETPDVLLTQVTSSGEKILIAIEFCSALQAGNQAWQRSGRAYSTARTNLCPYLYIIDFVKYELDSSRSRKALRFPNPAIPFSYYMASRYWKYPIIQVYFKSEEFQPSLDSALADFNPSLFGENDVHNVLNCLLYDKDPSPIFNRLLSKSLKVMEFMTADNSDHNFSKKDWLSVIHDFNSDIIAFSKHHNKFSFSKTIAQKSITGHNIDFASLATKYSIGIASRDLPFGLIPAHNRLLFASELRTIYPSMSQDFFEKLSVNADLIVCMFKGFKPRGDDARPDRGILPLIAMLTSETIEIMTFIYGETSASTLKKLDENILSLAKGNGLWSSVVSLSNFIILDAPLLSPSKPAGNALRLIENSSNKAAALSERCNSSSIMISPVPSHYSENDVDSFMHIIFKYIVPGTFEGFCNPPGGDWSGISLIDSLNSASGREFRWLTLPRVSHDSKRPDHITILFGLTCKPLIICTESKELPSRLEADIGPQLKKYISDLLSYSPSVERLHVGGAWTVSTAQIYFNNFKCASIGCFFAPCTMDLSLLYEKCKCDVFIGFEIDQVTQKCKAQITGCTNLGTLLADYLKEILQNNHLPINIFDTLR